MAAKLLSVTQAAERLGVTPARVYVWINENRLKSTTLGYHIYIEEKHCVKPAPLKAGRPPKPVTGSKRVTATIKTKTVKKSKKSSRLQA